MIDIIPTLAENISEIAVSNPEAVYTSWSNVWQSWAVMALCGVFIGWGIGYQMFRVGLRFPWHIEEPVFESGCDGECFWSE